MNRSLFLIILRYGRISPGSPKGDLAPVRSLCRERKPVWHSLQSRPVIDDRLVQDDPGRRRKLPDQRDIISEYLSNMERRSRPQVASWGRAPDCDRILWRHPGATGGVVLADRRRSWSNGSTTCRTARDPGHEPRRLRHRGPRRQLPIGHTTDARISRLALAIECTDVGWAIESTNRNGVLLHPWGLPPRYTQRNETTAAPRIALRVVGSIVREHWVLLEDDTRLTTGDPTTDSPIRAPGPAPVVPRPAGVAAGAVRVAARDRACGERAADHHGNPDAPPRGGPGPRRRARPGARGHRRRPGVRPSAGAVRLAGPDHFPSQ